MPVAATKLLPTTRYPKQGILKQSTSSPDASDQRSWAKHALCAEVDNEIFFPEKAGSATAAQFICSRCPVADSCLDEALATKQRFGIWGGLTERNRRQLQRLQMADVSAADMAEFITLARSTYDREFRSYSAIRALLRRLEVIQEEDETFVEEFGTDELELVPAETYGLA